MNDLPQESQGEALLPGPLGSAQIDLVCAALAEAQGEMIGVEMDNRNPFFNSRYSSLGAVIRASKGALGKHGLAIVQKISWQGSKLTMKTILTHKSGQWLDCGEMETEVTVPPPQPGKQARVSLVQAAGGLVTYLRRYSRAAVCQLYSDEDLDGNEHPEREEEPEYLPPQKPVTKEPVSVAALRMRALNVLQAAPGQPNRATVESFLIYRGWIKQGEQCEAWPEAHVPKTKQEMDALGAAVAQFDIDRHQPTNP